MQFQAILALVAFSGSCLAGKVDQGFLSSLSSGEKTDAILEFNPVLSNVLQSSALRGLSGDDRRTKIVSLMQQQTNMMQLPVMNALTSLGLAEQATPFWVANKVALSGVDPNILAVVSAIPGPFTLRAAQTVTSFPILKYEPVDISKRQSGNEPQCGVARINAPAVYSTTNGTGVVVGVIDTGLNAQHDALKGAYKNDEYSWKDMVNNRPEPYDDQGHGTHCAGTIAGQTNGIGVAPGAKIIACKALDGRGSGSEKTLMGCAQWMACPKNESGVCSEYPQVISNSWGGGNDNAWFNEVVKIWTAMDIVPVFAIGNAGPVCGTANSPGDQPGLISVGATDCNDKIASFSSRGPAGPGGVFVRLFVGRTIKPEVSAPGVDIVSASNNTNSGYVTMSGTSMATPHVAGAAALYLSQNKGAKWTEVRDALQSTAVKRPGDQYCSKFYGTAGSPNNLYGHGRIDIQKAMGL